jgi:hypothetical protein
MRPLLADAGFVLKPDFYGLTGGTGRQHGFGQINEVFLKASCAASSFLGWKGRGCSGVRSI